MARQVTLVLCDGDGEPLGTADPFAVEWPWWQDAEEVVAGAAVNGLDVIVLRLLGGTPAVEGGPLAGGEVTYLAELRGPAPAGLGPVSPVLVSTVLDDHRLRMPWARAGGPSDDLAWATWRLEESGLALTGPPTQVRSWNLSSIWRLATTRGTVWLKVVPDFFAHESMVLELVALMRPHVVPELVACEANRMLIADSPGEDLYGAAFAHLEAMARLLVGTQVALGDLVDELADRGASDWRIREMAPELARVVEDWSHSLDLEARWRLDAIVDGLEATATAVANAGLPDTLVHGDFHPGNVRGDPSTVDSGLTIIDWGDSGVGHPLLDAHDFISRAPAAHHDQLWRVWIDEWRKVVPKSDPLRAAELLAPLAALRNAAVFRHFCDNIEPSERPYHVNDVARALRAAANSAWGT
jgi:phosphotransferase family enzyme